MTIYLRWISDGSLVKKTLSGNRDAFGVLVERHLAMAHALAWGHTGSAADAEDIAQDAFLKAFTKLDTLREGDKFAGWLAGIVRNRAADQRLRAQRSQPLDPASLAQLPAPAHSPEQKEVYDLLHDALLTLEDSAREVLTLHYFAQKPLREVAELQGISREAANKRLQRAREALGKQLLSKLEGAPIPRQRLAARKTAILAALAATPFAWKAAAATGLSAGAIATAVGVITVAGALSFAGYEYGSEHFAMFFSSTSAAIAGPAHAAADAAALSPPAGDPVDAVHAAAPSEEAAGKGRIWGKVMDVNGAPVPKATIQIELVDWKPEEIPPTNTNRFQALNNPDGTYEFTGLPWGAYGVLAFGGNAADVIHSRVDAEIPERQEDLYLKPGLPIAGRVVTTAGAPVPGVVLQPCFYEPMGPIDDYVATSAVRAVSDSEGHFRIGLIWPGKWQLLARAEGYSPTVSDNIEAGSQTTQVTLLGGGTVSGMLLRDGSLAPVAGLTVQLKGNGPASLAPSAVTAPDGSFEITNVPPGTYTAALKSETAVLKDPPEPFTVDSGSETALDLRVGGGGTVSGRVYDVDTNEGVPGAQVHIQSAMVGDVYRDVVTDAVGGFFFPILPDGAYRLESESDSGYFPVNVEGSLLIIVANEHEVETSMPVTRGVKLSGTVVDPGGAPLKGAYLSAMSRRFGSVQTDYASTTSEEDGTFVIWVRDPRSTVTINASREGLASEPLKLPEAGTQGRDGLVIRLSRPAQGKVEVKITTTGLEQELAVQMVEAYLSSTSGTPSLGNSVRIAPTGIALFENVLPGNYQVHINNRNYGSAFCQSEEFAVPPGERTVKVAIECFGAAKGTVAGLVHDEDGAPIAGAKVFAYGVTGNASAATTDTAGRFVLEDVVKDARNVSVSAEGYMSASAPASVDGPEVQIQLSRGDVVRGQVLDADTGEPVSSFTVWHATSHGPNAAAVAAKRAETTGSASVVDGATEGRFAISVPLGAATGLRITARGYESGRATVEDPSEAVVVRLGRGETAAGVVNTPAGRPLSGVLISTAILGSFDDPGQANSVTSDIDGAFAIEHVSPGVLLYFRHPSYPPMLRAVPPSGPMNVAMGAGAVFSGRVTPWPQPGARVEMEAHDFVRSGTTSAMVSADGTFRMEQLPEGPATVRLMVAAGEPGAASEYHNVADTAEVILADGQETTYTFEVEWPQEVSVNSMGGAAGPDSDSDDIAGDTVNDDEQVDGPASDESP